jgi:hypothetical protein
VEPKLGQFNERAFAQMDMVVAEARSYGIKLFGEFDGDASATAPTGSAAAPTGGSNFESHNWYCIWRGASPCGMAFFSDPALLGDYERHMKAVLDHVNPLTGLAYKDDPTFVGWVDGNNLNLADGVPPPIVEAWLAKVSSYFKSIDTKQLFADISLTGGDELVTPTVLQIPGIDIYGQEYYPHWFPVVQGGDRVDGTAPLLHAEAAQIAAAGKVYATLEYGWDHTNFLTSTALKQFLTGLTSDKNVAGDNFWALQVHKDGHGWQPIPGDAGCIPTCEEGEDGNWWAMYYTGLRTLSNQAGDMAVRAQLLRAHAYELGGFGSIPAHERVPAPIITSASDGKIQFEGAAGSPTYTIQKRTASGRWATVCDHCTTDAAGGWQDPDHTAACYRIIGYNLDTLAGPASDAVGTRCPTPNATTCPTTRTITLHLRAVPRSPISVLVNGHRVKARRRRRTLTITLPKSTAGTVRIDVYSHKTRLRRLAIHGCAIARR